MITCALLLSSALAAAPERWSAARANEWYAAQPWLVGCNFLPSTAVNDVEMWQAATFDPPTLDRELGWAHDLGYNSVRVFLNYVVWEADADGLRQRFEQFLALADRHALRVMPILFDDCFKPEPRVGPQDPPVPGVHNSQWVRSPGVKRVADTAGWPRLEAYVTDLVGRFAHDPRIVLWDLYNEPEAKNQPLVEATFRWARAAGPRQPLASCWGAEGVSDLVNLHHYGPLAELRRVVDKARATGRPVLVTEWMARGAGSRCESHLPYFKAERLGCWHWGLVAGRTQTYFPWGSPEGAPEPALWHHDLLRADGTPYRPREVATIRHLTGVSPDTPAEPLVLVPTAEAAPVHWRCTETRPGDDWHQPGFDDSAWHVSPAPFGRAEANLGRAPRTTWTSADLWLRRVIEVPPGEWSDLALRLHYDEDPQVYVDGEPVLRLAGYNAAYESFPLPAPAAARLTPGKHLVAVHCHQTVGGQYFDLGVEGVPTQRWSVDRAWAWYRRLPWLVGCNYVPSSAANTTEFWGRETFDEPTIDRELGWAQSLGFNTCRVFVQYLVWQADPAGLEQRLDRFLALADRHGLSTTVVLFDDCVFGDPPVTEPYLGPQREPVPGMILPSWTPSPGLKAVTDKSAWPGLERYVKAVVGRFGQDPRVLLWDLYNEPGNSGMGNRSLPLVEATFSWARAARPSQPLTMSVWGAPAELSRRQLELSDIPSFHCYGTYDAVRRQIAQLKQHGRPVINTEWMARPLGGQWATDLPLFKLEAVGCYCWGLVNGRTQAQFSWRDKRGTPEPKVWFHDLFHRDGRPYDPAEHAAIRATTAQQTIDWRAADYTRPQALPGQPAHEEGGVAYSAGWTRWQGDGPLGGHLHYANTAGARASWTAPGPDLVLLHKVGPDCGVARVLIDGQPAAVAELDTWSARVEWNHRSTLATGLAPGPHRVTVEVTGRRRAESTDCYVQLVGYATP